MTIEAGAELEVPAVQLLSAARQSSKPRQQDIARLLAQANFERGRGQAALAFGLYKWAGRLALMIGKSLEAPLNGLVAIALQRRRHAVARRLLEHPVLLGSSKRLLPAHRAELALLSGDTARCLAIVAQTPREQAHIRLQRLADIARRVEAEKAAGDAMAGIRHIAIGGTAHVGSTLFGLIMGSLPGLAFAGETRWLVNQRDKRPDGSRPTILDDDVDEADWHEACRVCGAGCTRFTPDFRLGVAKDQTGWFAQFARRLGVETLVSSDKAVWDYWRLDPLFRFDLIVLFKSPMATTASALKPGRKRHGKVGAGEDGAVVGTTLDIWSETYMGLLKLIRPRGKLVVMDWDRFTAAPDAHLERIADALALPSPEGVLNRIKLGHFVGGSFRNADLRPVQETGRIAIRPSTSPPLADELADAVARHGEAAFVHRLLQTAHRRTFGEF